MTLIKLFVPKKLSELLLKSNQVLRQVDMSFRYFVLTHSIKNWLRFTVIATEKGICRIVFGEVNANKKFAIKSPNQKVEQLKVQKIHSDFPDFVTDTINQLLDYFNGKRKEFNVPLDVAEYSAFMQKIWQVTMSIPYGEVRSYAWVARLAGFPSSVRAVGQAMRLNPVPPIIPCHRVIHADGSLGGYSAGLNWKIRLLQLEGITVEKDRVHFY